MRGGGPGAAGDEEEPCLCMSFGWTPSDFLASSASAFALPTAAFFGGACITPTPELPPREERVTATTLSRCHVALTASDLT